MISDMTRKYRDIFSYGLLALAALYVLSGISLLFKSEEDAGLAFSGRAAAFGYLFAHPFVVLGLLGAVALAVGLGEASKNARIIVLAALGIAGLALLFYLISWFSSFGADSDLGSFFGGVVGAGKIVGLLLGLAQLAALALTALFVFSCFQALPKATPQAQQWGQPGQAQGYGQQGYPPQGGYPPQAYGDQQQGGWQQAEGGYAPPQQSWQQPAAQDWSSQGYAGGASADVAAAGTGWGGQSPEQSGWTPPQQGEPQAWAPETSQQGWQQPEQQSWEQPAQPEQPSWEQPAQPEQQSWEQPAQQGWDQQQADYPPPQPAWDQPAEALPPTDPAAGQQPDQTWIEPADQPASAAQPDVAEAESSEPPASSPHGATVAGEPAADEGTDTGTDDDDGQDKGGWWQPTSR